MLRSSREHELHDEELSTGILLACVWQSAKLSLLEFHGACMEHPTDLTNPQQVQAILLRRVCREAPPLHYRLIMHCAFITFSLRILQDCDGMSHVYSEIWRPSSLQLTLTSNLVLGHAMSRRR